MNKQKVKQAMVTGFQEEGVTTNPPSGQICQPKWLGHRRGNARKMNTFK